ncbi:MAG: helix-turn-helix transcriptional regulator [Clostridiales bacterium]|nr:helix-turn-helix transcriptional regulator [Clostridiales bacterium]
MKLNEAISKRILNLCHKNNITVNKLAMRSGVYQSTVNNILLGFSNNPRILTIYRICQGFDITIDEFFKDELFSDIEDE